MSASESRCSIPLLLLAESCDLGERRSCLPPNGDYGATCRRGGELSGESVEMRNCWLLSTSRLSRVSCSFESGCALPSSYPPLAPASRFSFDMPSIAACICAAVGRLAIGVAGGRVPPLWCGRCEGTWLSPLLSAPAPGCVCCCSSGTGRASTCYCCCYCCGKLRCSAGALRLLPSRSNETLGASWRRDTPGSTAA